MTTKVLITGAGGQLGSELVEALANKFGKENIVATDINEKVAEKFSYCTFEVLDIKDIALLEQLVENYQITQIYHLAALLSAVGERNPLFTWDLNMNGLLGVLEIARKKNIDRVFWPSSIAAFGVNTPKKNTPQDAPTAPGTVYGITKISGELWCQYYFEKYGVDVRSLRYPGLIGYKSLPGGGTTDYAVDIYHKAIAGETFSCFLSEDTYLPMMYMPDAIKATLDLMDAPKDQVKVRTSYNVSALSFSPKEVYESILKFIPDFKIEYAPDFRQQIADSWPDSIDDSRARTDWGWKPTYDLDKMSEDIITHLKQSK
ncbi:NAD-dependent epimerase/dehydratase family protein [Capnocytophaga canimorsus]|uniref:NAD-dependent epimerase/dehydratase family protein n=1 Tax=Capnocytophaga canimorsus TaxID=28188 RepID=UPI001EDF9B70|nr:NAD-dependent epimerase/dehydratase family protein [Capnocytophaga canimorsus]GJQ04465.1 L-threonine 3-dehydrogenase [Capnocytophaga canimorsus]